MEAQASHGPPPLRVAVYVGVHRAKHAPLLPTQKKVRSRR